MQVILKHHVYLGVIQYTKELKAMHHAGTTRPGPEWILTAVTGETTPGRLGLMAGMPNSI
jgi:hypothetical protein